jgi:8-oxo-dGTP diphosphatase
MNKNITEKDKEFLKTYDSNKYEHPSVTVDILIFTVDISGKLELLLIKRKRPPFQDCWAIPGGFVNMNESLEEAAARELMEETSITDVHMEQLYTFGNVDRDPRTRVISVAYMVLIPKEKLSIKAGDDAKEAEWFQVSLKDNSLTFNKNIELAFDHEDIIKVAIERLRGKLSYTNIAMNLVNDIDRFTIYELQKINEAILGTDLNAANFRRSFIMNYINKGIVEETGEKCTEYSHRASNYYRVI